MKIKNYFTITAIALLSIVLVFNSCEKKRDEPENRFVGTWVGQHNVQIGPEYVTVKIKLMFNEDKTCSLVGVKLNSAGQEVAGSTQSVKGTYKYSTSHLTVLPSAISAFFFKREYEYAFSDNGKQLELTDEDFKTITLKRQEKPKEE